MSDETAVTPLFEDALTGLYNRRFLYRYLEERVPWKVPAGPVSVVLLDIDRFRKVNEKHGEGAGDMVLNQFGALLREATSPTDVVGRHGGDSFLAIIPGADKDAAIALGDRIREMTLERAFGPRDRSTAGLSVSGGVATFPEDAGSLQTLVDAVDRALYVSKRVGCNVVSAAGRLDEGIAGERKLFSTLPCPLFVDREIEMATAISLFDRLCERKTVLAFLQGEAGAGKSRFLREIAKRARTAGLLHLYVSCDESKKFVPGHPLLQFVDRYYASRAPESKELRNRLSAVQRAAVRDFVPAFQAWTPEAMEPAAKDRRHFMQQAVELALLAMSEQQPLLFMLDNVAHADRTTIEILRGLVRTRRAPVGVTLALKGDLQQLDLRKDAALFELVGEFEQQGMRTLLLRGMAYDDVLKMVRAILPGAKLPDRFDAIIAGRSGGNPLYAEQAIRYLMLTGRIRRAGGAWHVSPVTAEELPESLDDAIRAVLDHLPEEASEVLTNAAVIGSTFDFKTLAAVSGRREAEMLDIVDQMEQVGLVRARPEGAEAEFEFTAGHVREVGYECIPEAKKQRLHKRVAGALKEQGALAAAEATWHAERAKGSAKPSTRVMEQAAAALTPLRRPRIAEATNPLDKESTGIALDLMRHLLNTLKIRRLYPEDSRTEKAFRAKYRDATQQLLALSRTVTFSMDARGPRINGEAMPFRKDELREEWALLFADRLVSSLTLQAGVSDAELDALAVGLAAPLQTATAPPDHWDRWLDGEGVRGLDILQRRFISHDTKTIRRPAATRESMDVPKERPLSLEEIDVLWKALRHLKAGADSLRLYPAGHPLVEDSIAASARAFEELLAAARIVTLSAPENDLVVNGVALDPKRNRSAAVYLAAEFRRRDMRSVSIREDFTANDVRALVVVLTAADVSKAIAESGVRGIVFDVRTYERVTPNTMVRTKDPREADRLEPATAAEALSVAFETKRRATGPTRRRMKPDAEDDLRARARALLKAPADEFLADKAERWFAPMLAALGNASLVALAEQLVDRLASFLRSPDAGIRRGAAFLAARSIAETATGPRAMLVVRLQEALTAAVAAEADPPALRAFGEASRVWINAALAAGQHASLIQFLADGVKQQMDAPDNPATIRTSLFATLRGLAALSPNPVLEALKTGAPKLRSAAVKVVGLMGPAFAEAISDIVAGSDDVNVRRAGALALKEIGADGGAALCSRVRADAPTAAALRVLDVLELTRAPNMPSAVLAALNHAESSVHDAAFRLLKRGERFVTTGILRELLALDRSGVRASALALARDLRLQELVPDVVRLCTTADDEDVVRAGCMYFRECPSPAAIPVLQRVFEHRTKVFGLVKGASTKTRAAAIAALARIDHPSARALLEIAEDDRSQTVRRAARPDDRKKP